MGKIPEGWLPYAPIGNQVPGTRFIAFKVPLREAFVDKLQDDDRFTINVLLDKIPDLGLVIDLTHTTKYYNKREFLDRGVDYVKIQTPGQIVPPQNLVERFFEVVDYYLDSHKNDNSLIGVHCTHGVNRTGYMLCRYLIQRLGYSFNEAVEAVGRARGHLIERSPYLSSLEEIKGIETLRTTAMRPSASKTKLGKKEEVPAKKDEPRRNLGKDGFRGDYRTSPGRVSMVPGRSVHRARSRSPLQQHPRGRVSPVPVGGRTSPLQAIRSRRSPPHYDRPVTGQPRGSQQSVIRDRMVPTMPHGRTPPPQPRGRTPPHSFRTRTPPPPSLHLSHLSPPGHMRRRSPPSVMRNRTSPSMLRRSPPRPQGRGRSPPPDLMNRMPVVSSRGRSPPPHMRGRSPPIMRGRSPPGHIRSRSPPGRSIRRRTPTHYSRVPSPGHDHIPVSIPPSPGHGHISRREQMPHARGRSQPPGRGRSPPRRERTPPPIQSSRRPSSPDYRRNEPPSDRHYSTRPGYEDGGRRGAEESVRDYNDRFHTSNHYSNERSYGASAEYYPERYEKIRRERSLSPRRNYPYYPYPRDEVPVRAEYSPPRDTKRRRKTPPPVEVREKLRRSTPPSGYMNSRDGREGFKKDKREYPAVPWDIKEKDPDCREILNEKRSMRDVYPDSNLPSYSDVPKYAPVNADLREALEEEKRRRHVHSDSAGYHGQDIPPEERNVMHQGYPQQYPYRSEGEMVRGRARQDFPGGSSNHDSGIRPDNQRHHGYQDSAPYPEPKHHRSQGEFVKSRDDDFRKSRGRRTKRVFDRLSRGGRGRGGGHWP
ncbi:serine/arginine repetitive matrix protein 1 isoform X2 [Halyomorpha halys]|uniref:serine/arginine repetitive matrix protein 1 isoform X2 n=1 Tax=Halyomorpha halys TaxID=286706 RepID=UPI0006D4CED4|nr:serine/arginine repetitive matrix protein 1 isoform X2 [Halyomorpha halys]